MVADGARDKKILQKARKDVMILIIKRQLPVQTLNANHVDSTGSMSKRAETKICRSSLQPDLIDLLQRHKGSSLTTTFVALLTLDTSERQHGK